MFTQEWKELVLQKVRVGLSQTISKAMCDEMQFGYIEDLLVGNVIAGFKSWAWAEELDTRELKVHFDYPATTWQMFKHQHFPKRLLKRFPIKFATITKTVHFSKKAVYPQLPIAFPNKVGHIKFTTDIWEKRQRSPFEDDDDEL